MQFEQVFASAIEVGIATAGFSGIVVVLGQRSEGVWNRADLARVSILLQASFVAIAFSFLALKLDGAGLAEETIWRTGSACFVLYAVAAVPLRRRLGQRIQAVDPTFSPALINALLPVALLVAAAQAYNAALLGSGWLFVLAVIWELAIALVAFVRLLQTFWEKPAAQQGAAADTARSSVPEGGTVWRRPQLPWRWQSAPVAQSERLIR